MPAFNHTPVWPCGTNESTNLSLWISCHAVWVCFTWFGSRGSWTL